MYLLFIKNFHNEWLLMYSSELSPRVYNFEEAKSPQAPSPEFPPMDHARSSQTFFAFRSLTTSTLNDHSILLGTASLAFIKLPCF